MDSKECLAEIIEKSRAAQKNFEGFNQQQVDFYKYSGNTSTYYDLWLNDTHFIFLAGKEAGLTAKISDEQFAWLREKLAENYAAGRPIKKQIREINKKQRKSADG